MTELSTALRLYLVTDPALCAQVGLVQTVQAAVCGGVSMVQLRDKEANTAARIAAAHALKDALSGSGIPLIINDDLEAACAACADGLHIGQGDIDPAEARRRLGPGRILGLSCETPAHVRAADPGIVDYLGLGPVFGTATKPGHAAPVGMDGLAEMVACTELPTVAIGGLNAAHEAEVLAAGVDGMAVVSAICGQPDPEVAARAFTLSRRNDR